MGPKFETIERRITSMLSHLQSECGILERLAYKNKNQHRRCSYFRHLLKVKKDLKLLQLANLEELVTSCLFVIKGDRPKQKIHLLESLKRRKCNDEKHNFLERLLGSARLLAEMVEPILKATTYPSTSINYHVIYMYHVVSIVMFCSFILYAQGLDGWP